MNAKHELAAGLFMIIGLLLFAISVWVLGRERQIFVDQEPYYTTFRDIKGLHAGAPVRLSGISIGRVDEVGFGEDLADPTVKVKLLINENFVERIRDDSVASIETQGLLGDRLVSISSGTSKKQLLPGAHIHSAEGSDFSEVLAKASEVVDNVVEISGSVRDIAVEIREEALLNFSKGAANFAALTEEIKSGKGLLHRLFYSKKDGDTLINSLDKAVSGISKIIHQVEHGKGLVHALLYEDSTGSMDALLSAAKSVSETSSYVNKLIADIRDGEGFLHDLVYEEGPAQFNEIVTNLNTMSENLQKASAALAQGEGTIGALLIDSKLYDNLVEVTDGAKRSFILRHAIRSAMNQ